MCEEFEIITYRRRGPERKTWAIYIWSIFGLVRNFSAKSGSEGSMFAVVPFARPIIAAGLLFFLEKLMDFWK
jgi:hypothetical protein